MSSCCGSQTIYSEDKTPVPFSRLLAVDTATQACSVAISYGNNLMVEHTNVVRQTHSRHLLSMIQNALTLSRLKLSDLDGFVVTKGPGSFTGLRIGISTVKGLAMAVDKPLVGVSYLKCLAIQSGVAEGLVCAVIDARRSECYYALYRFGRSGMQTVMSESVGSLMHVADEISEPCLFIGNGIHLYQDQLRQKLGQLVRFAPDFNNILRANTQIVVGRSRLVAGKEDFLDTFVPKYIRKSDAQINLDRRFSDKMALQ